MEEKEDEHVRSDDERMKDQHRRERANVVHFEFWFCSHLLRQPLGSHLQPLVTQASKFQHVMISPRAALGKTGISSQNSIAEIEIVVFSRAACGEMMIFSGQK